MIVYLKNMAGYKIQHFKGMTYDQVRPIFEREYNSVQAFLKSDRDKEPSKKRAAKETLLPESFKKLRAEVEVSGSPSTQKDTPTIDPTKMSKEDVKDVLQIILVAEFKVESLHLRNSLEEVFTHQEEMELETTQTSTTAKLPVLKQGDYEMCRLRIEQNFQDAKTLFAAIQTRFGGNKATKKTQKTLLKQMYENFSVPSTDLPSEWNTHVVVWRNKLDLDTMSFDDLYNNFKIIEQEVKGTANSSLSSQNMAFVSSPTNTNEVNTDYGVSTVNTQASPGNTQASTASTKVSTTNLSDATVYAFLASQLNGSQLVHKDLIQIHEDDLEEIDLKWKLALLKEIASNAMVAIDGGSFDWSYMVDDEVLTNMAFMDFLDFELKHSTLDFSYPDVSLPLIVIFLPVFWKKFLVLILSNANFHFKSISSKSSSWICISNVTGTNKDYILMPLWKYCLLLDSSSKNASNDEPQPSSDVGKKDDDGVTIESGINDQERPENSTQDVNTLGPSINTVSTNVNTVGLSINIVSTNVNTVSLNINTVSLSVTTALLEATHADLFGDETKKCTLHIHLVHKKIFE
nr:hypothetical protein [Tanacetum cinerariifolium]